MKELGPRWVTFSWDAQSYPVDTAAMSTTPTGFEKTEKTKDEENHEQDLDQHQVSNSQATVQSFGSIEAELAEILDRTGPAHAHDQEVQVEQQKEDNHPSSDGRDADAFDVPTTRTSLPSQTAGEAGEVPCETTEESKEKVAVSTMLEAAELTQPQPQATLMESAVSAAATFDDGTPTQPMEVTQTVPEEVQPASEQTGAKVKVKPASPASPATTKNWH